jgi:hypothetical protein
MPAPGPSAEPAPVRASSAVTETAQAMPEGPSLREEDLKAALSAEGVQALPDADLKALLVYLQAWKVTSGQMTAALHKVEELIADPEALRKLIVDNTDNAVLKAMAQRADAHALASLALTFNPLRLEKARKDHVIEELGTTLRKNGLALSVEGTTALLEAAMRKLKVTDPVVEGRINMLYDMLVRIAKPYVAKQAGH